MSNALTVSTPTTGALTDPTLSFIGTLEKRWRLCTALVRSGLIPQKSPEAALAVMLKGHELGIPPMMAFANIHFFDGKLTLSAALMCAVASQRYGVKWSVQKHNAQGCAILFTRPGWEPYQSVYTWEEAKSAGLVGKQNWRNYPKAMLLARAQSQGIRAICPEAFAGVYDPEELGAPVNEDGDLIVPQILEVEEEPRAEEEGVRVSEAEVVMMEEEIEAQEVVLDDGDPF